MSKSYHRSAKKFDDDVEDEDTDTKSKKEQRFMRQLKRVFREDKDLDT